MVPKGLQRAVLEAMHGAARSRHFGVAKTLRRLRQSFYWGQSRRNVEDFCQRCDPCTARKGPAGRSHTPLQQFLVGAPMGRVAVDVVGPLPCSEGGNRYVLTAIDYFTKWPEAYALPDQEAETVADALVGGMFSRFAVPESLHSDQGRNFESRVFGAMCERLGIHKTRITPQRPQSDGLVERFHRTMGQQLAILTCPPAPGAHVLSLCRAGIVGMHAISSHAGKGVVHPCRAGVWSTPRCSRQSPRPGVCPEAPGSPGFGPPVCPGTATEGGGEAEM